MILKTNFDIVCSNNKLISFVIWYENGMFYNYNINPGDSIINIKIREALFNDYKSAGYDEIIKR